MTLLFTFTGLLLCAQIFTIGVLVFDGWRVRRNAHELPPASLERQTIMDSDAGIVAAESDCLCRTTERRSRVAA